MRELLDFLLCCFRGHKDEVVLNLSWRIELRRCSRCGRLRTGPTMAAWAAPLIRNVFWRGGLPTDWLRGWQEKVKQRLEGE